MEAAPERPPPRAPRRALSRTVAFHRDPLAFLRAAQVEFGDVFTIRLLERVRDLTDEISVPVAVGARDAPAQVARQGYDALIAGMEKVVAGSLKNKLQAAVAGASPIR